MERRLPNLDCQLLTANGQSDLAISVRRGERVPPAPDQCDSSVGSCPVSVPGQTAWVMAIDGQPAEPFVARDSQRHDRARQPAWILFVDIS